MADHLSLRLLLLSFTPSPPVAAAAATEIQPAPKNEWEREWRGRRIGRAHSAEAELE